MNNLLSSDRSVMPIENPYQPPDALPYGGRAVRSRASLLQIFGWLFGFAFFGACLLFAMGSIYFTLHPAALQAGNQAVRASFDDGDYPELLTEIGVAAGFAVAMGWCAVKTGTATRHWLRKWATKPNRESG